MITNATVNNTMTKRIFLDTTALALMNSLMGDSKMLEKLESITHTLVIANTAIDVSVFQNNQAWFEQLLASKKIVIEDWNMSTMFSKTFYWSSLNITTPPCADFDTALANVAEQTNECTAAKIKNLAEIIRKYMIPKGSWEMGPWSPPAPFNVMSYEADILGIYKTDITRSDIYLAAKANGSELALQAYSAYNAGYVKGLATQHCCDYILNCDGTLTEVTP